LETSNPDIVDAAIEELYFERSDDESPTPLTGDTRKALDHAFSRATVEDIVSSLGEFAKQDDEVGQWAKTTLEELHLRSPTSLKVALHAVRRGKTMSLGEVLQMEMGVATAFIVRQTASSNSQKSLIKLLFIRMGPVPISKPA
jgi:3-hydroxyisobutyryl-CoA hydrolase